MVPTIAQMHAVSVKCCRAGQVAFPLDCPWHGRTDPMYVHWDEEHADPDGKDAS